MRLVSFLCSRFMGIIGQVILQFLKKGSIYGAEMGKLLNCEKGNG